MGRNEGINVPEFLNCVDLRGGAKNNISEIEEQRIRETARAMGSEELSIFLSEVSPDLLVSAISARIYFLETKVKAIKRCMVM